MKVLVAKPIFPIPPDQGTKRVTLDLLEALGARHDVTFFSRVLARHEARGVAFLPKGVRGEVLLAPNRRSPLHRLGWKLRLLATAGSDPRPQSVRYATLPPVARRFAEIAREVSPDAILVEYWYAWPLLEALPSALAGVPRLLLAHDVDFLGARSGSGSSAERETEIRAFRRFDGILTLTETDADAIRGSGGPAGPPVRLLPFGVPIPREGAPAAEREPDTILFVGSLAADFNREGLEWFAAEVLPAVRARLPGARFRIAGGPDSAWLRRVVRRTAGEWLGVRETLLPEFRRASLLVIPLLHGGGLRIRLLEALAAGTPVVTTPVGAAGVRVRGDSEVLLAEGAADFAEAALRVLSDPELASSLSRNARAAALASYDRERTLPGMAEAFLHLCREVAERRAVKTG